MLWPLLFLLFSLPVQAQNSAYEPIIRKQHDKTRARWTLEDVWTSKKKRRTRSRWLPWQNKRKTFFEMIVDIHGGAPAWKRDGTDGSDDDFLMAGANVQMFFGPLGIGIGRDQYKFKEGGNYSQRDEGIFFLRVLGSSTQTTQLTLIGGIQKNEHNYYGDYDNNFYGLLTNFYLFRYMGLEAQYRNKTATTSETHKISGQEYHWGLFWELSILRLYMVYHQDFNQAKNKITDSKDNERINGPMFGARLYF